MFSGVWREDLECERGGELPVRWLLRKDRSSEEVEIIADVEYSANDGEADQEGDE